MYAVRVDGDAIIEALERIDRLTAEVTAAFAEFDAGGLWEVEGATFRGVVAARPGPHAGPAAKALVRNAQRLGALPVTRQAWVEGSLSGGQVAAVTANVSPRCAPLFAEHEAAVVPSLSELSVADTAAAMRLWRARAEAVVDGDEPSEPERSIYIYLSRTMDGRFELSGALDVEGGNGGSRGVCAAT